MLLTAADVIGRLVARPAEVDVGIVTAIIGAPIFIWSSGARSACAVTAVAVQEAALADRVATGRRRRALRRRSIGAALAVVVLVLFAVSLMVGDTFYTPSEVLRTILGETVPGASFTVGELRLPRACMGALAGLAFGVAGVTFQTMLRNPLAAPDVIGISSGASAAAVVSIVLLQLDEAATSLIAIVAALATAAVIYLLSYRTGSRAPG